MNQVKRTFVAIKIKPEHELLDLLAECREIFNDEAIKWVHENNLHLTLKFLGETSEEQVQQTKSILEKTGIGATAFSFSLKGLGYFKSKGQPRVFFTSISGFETMEKIAGELEEQLFNVGFEKETRIFKPHLTLARIKFLRNKKRFYEFVDRYKNKMFQTVTVSEIVFYESILKPQGPKYVPLKTVQLKP